MEGGAVVMEWDAGSGSNRIVIDDVLVTDGERHQVSKMCTKFVETNEAKTSFRKLILLAQKYDFELLLTCHIYKNFADHRQILRRQTCRAER